MRLKKREPVPHRIEGENKALTPPIRPKSMATHSAHVHKFPLRIDMQTKIKFPFSLFFRKSHFRSIYPAIYPYTHIPCKQKKYHDVAAKV